MQRTFLTFVVGGALGLVSFVCAQQGSAPVQLSDLEGEVGDQGTPQFSVGNVDDKPANPENWLELEIMFQLRGGDEKWTDGVSVHWYLGLVDASGVGVILPVEVDYLNVPIGEEVHAAVYTNPRNVQRITGKDRVSSGDIQFWAAVVYDKNGSPLGFVDQDGPKSVDRLGEPDLFFNSNAVPQRQGVLRPRSETPFAVLWTDYYLEESTEEGR